MVCLAEAGWMSEMSERAGGRIDNHGRMQLCGKTIENNMYFASFHFASFFHFQDFPIDHQHII